MDAYQRLGKLWREHKQLRHEYRQLKFEHAAAQTLLKLYMRGHNYQWWNADEDYEGPFDEGRQYCMCEKCLQTKELLESAPTIAEAAHEKCVLTMLKAVEWGGMSTMEPTCPNCGSVQDDLHSPMCDLAIMIGAQRREYP
jgi:hypothetical protein